jgi:hypothetical protein
MTDINLIRARAELLLRACVKRSNELFPLVGRLDKHGNASIMRKASKPDDIKAWDENRTHHLDAAHMMRETHPAAKIAPTAAELAEMDAVLTRYGF